MAWAFHISGAIVAAIVIFNAECQALPAYKKLFLAVAWPVSAAGVSAEIILYGKSNAISKYKCTEPPHDRNM